MSSATEDSELDLADVDAPVDIWHKYPGIAESKFFHEFLTRLVVGRDMHVMVTGASETGIGKTTIAYVIACLWDMHGWTREKATLYAPEYSKMYDNVSPGTVLILDEAERVGDSRRSMSEETRQLGMDFATKRYRQVFGILTLPSKNWLDDRLSDDSMDYWIQCQETDEGRPKGEAKVYRMKNEEHYETSYTTKTETISWPIMDGYDEFDALEEMKAEASEGEVEDKYVHRDEVEEIKSNYWNKAVEQTENDLIESMCKFGLSQSDIAAIVGVTQPTISRRLPDELV